MHFHVLCEKPIGLNVQDALPLLEVRDRTGVRIEEAFMDRILRLSDGLLIEEEVVVAKVATS